MIKFHKYKIINEAKFYPMNLVIIGVLYQSSAPHESSSYRGEIVGMSSSSSHYPFSLDTFCWDFGGSILKFAY